MKSIILTLFIFCMYNICQVKCGCNLNGLSRVNGTTVNFKGKAEYHNNVNLNLMDGYRIIEITKANITELCQGMVKNFPRLTELNIIGVNISSMEKNVFQKVPLLRRLSLAANSLTEIKSGHVNNIKSLEILYLSANRIVNVDGDAFENMYQLKKVYLAKNHIKFVNSNWFKGCPNIELIDLSHNKIRELPENAFMNIVPAYGQFTKYFLNHNMINYINPHVVQDEKPFLILYLQNNTMEELREEVIKSLRHVNGVILNNNLINCLSEEALEIMKEHPFSLHLINNPIQCPCLKRFDNFKKSFSNIRTSFHYNSTENCYKRKIPSYFLK